VGYSSLECREREMPGLWCRFFSCSGKQGSGSNAATGCATRSCNDWIRGLASGLTRGLSGEAMLDIVKFSAAIPSVSPPPSFAPCIVPLYLPPTPSRFPPPSSTVYRLVTGIFITEARRFTQKVRKPERCSGRMGASFAIGSDEHDREAWAAPSSRLTITLLHTASFRSLRVSSAPAAGQ
jgi:hypothetical protein